MYKEFFRTSEMSDGRNSCRYRVSASTNRSQVEFAAFAPAAQAFAFPAIRFFRGAGITSAPAARAASAVLSVESSSTTMTRTRGAKLFTAAPIVFASFRAGMITVRSRRSAAVFRGSSGRRAYSRLAFHRTAIMPHARTRERTSVIAKLRYLRYTPALAFKLILCDPESADHLRDAEEPGIAFLSAPHPASQRQL